MLEFACCFFSNIVDIFRGLTKKEPKYYRICNKCGILVLHYMIVGIKLEWLAFSKQRPPFLWQRGNISFFFIAFFLSSFVNTSAYWSLKEKLGPSKSNIYTSDQKKPETNIFISDFTLDLTSCFGSKNQLFPLTEGKRTAPQRCPYFLTSKQNKKKPGQKKKTSYNKNGMLLWLFFLYIKKDDPFLHYLVMNENFCGVILDVLSCLLTELVFLLSQNIQYSSISTVSTS